MGARFGFAINIMPREREGGGIFKFKIVLCEVNMVLVLPIW